MPTSVQTTLASQVLNQFHISIDANIVNKQTDWPTRQKTQYESMKGLMYPDWHGLKDFQKQLLMYSNTNIILTVAYAIIKALIPNNQEILATLTTIQGMGQVGNFLLSLTGFGSIFIAPQNILGNSNSLQSTINSLL